MLLALLLMPAVLSHADAFEMRTEPPHFFDEVCHVNRAGISSLNFHQTPAHPNRVLVRVRWRDGSQTSVRLENEERLSQREVRLMLPKHNGKQVQLGLRKGPRGTTGYLLSGDGSPFPVACFP